MKFPRRMRLLARYSVQSLTVEDLFKPAHIFLLTAALTLQTSRGAGETNSTTNAKTEVTTAEQMKALRKEVDDAETAYMKANASHDDQADKLWDVYRQINDPDILKIFELARQEPASQTAFEMFGWIVTNRRIQVRPLYTNAVQSLEFLRDHHATNPNIAKICWKLGNNWDATCQPARDFLQIAADKNPDREVRGLATFALARFSKQNAENMVFFSESAPPGNRWFEKAKTAYWEKMKGVNPETASREAEKLFNIVLDKYADCPTLQPMQDAATLGAVAKVELYDLEHLSVGKVAPEIEGEDIDGKKLRLSDFRGKIVMLSFWASWCGPCMQMVPSEAKLAERMKGKPFALIGVNGDSNPNDAKRAVEKEKMTWPSFWSEGGGDGPIPTSWNVRGWPAVYVLDANGVIRFKGEDIDLLNQKIDQLLEQFADKTHN